MLRAYARYEPLDFDISIYTYKCNFDVPEDFGEIGAVLVENEYSKKMFFKNIVLDNGVTFTCESWVHSKNDNPDKRIFFADKSYLPSETPNGLKSLREQDMISLRGNGEGERKSFERIYDYDLYNDLGAPDEGSSLARPVLGGEKQPYPRRCTGREMSSIDPLTETRTLLPFYIPADEDFSEIKQVTFGARTLYSALHAVVPVLKSVFTDKTKGFPLFTDIDMLFNQGVNVPAPDDGVLSALPILLKKIDDTKNAVIQFEMPETLERDKFSWLSDEEFCRQMLAGLNPCSIQLVKEWPLMSKLDPEIYGPAESLITKEIVEKEIKDFMTFDEALAQKKLFMLDYHDLLLPYVNKLRDIETTTLYGSRTLMLLTPDGTLRPLAIELTHPPYDGKPQWKHVYTPARTATDLWLWRLAKAHVLAHDAGYHQLISHWLLRTHCATEPYIIATNRHLSQMHPMSRLLLPHCRYTMQINSLARLILINAGVEDPTAPHGLKLAIEDYPYANDANLVESDEELQAWWNEIRMVGHGDKKDEPWWPQLKTQEDLIGIVSTIMWVTAGQHSAVNFGQYDLGGYIPYRPTVARTNMPNEDPTDEEWQSFVDRPEDTLLKCFPSQLQGIQTLVLYNVLSSHSPDEEYIGGITNATWEADPTIKATFEEFRGRLNELEAVIDSRNIDPTLKNRYGVGLVPYQLLIPYSESGVTGRGVANSISI
ncbi:hypothetical protein M8C21_008549 [Ambrosia artemisiifolia]|uniref:Lipoxygenase n=1 Tax=Ambrosia artemisiifolia TaxID=4212 RepID=A0AAD5G2J6_AMBAR|nr:hypothetical protein M8C21_008549 [Ambrosia artemisiifolia]